MSHDVLDLLEQAGLSKAKANATEKIARLKKLQAAYQAYEWVRQENVNKFNEDLKEKSLKARWENGRDLIEKYDTLCFTKLEEYEEVPPVDALTAVIEAKKLGVFDEFEVAQIRGVEVYKDPIIFGRIKGCTDRFFICQFDEDVKFEDLVKAEPKT